MIKTKEDYSYYINADRISLGYIERKRTIKSFIKGMIIKDYIWLFQKTLRKIEYLTNKKNIGIIEYFILMYKKYRYRRLSIKLGFSIPINCFGPGLSIAHIGPIIINSSAKIGSNCLIHVGVNIGTEAGYNSKAPIIGDNVYIGPGAKLFGAIKIAKGCAIGANAVVNKSFEKENSLIIGIPAHCSTKTVNTGKYLVKGTRILDLKIPEVSIKNMSSIEIFEYLFDKGY